MAITLVPKRHSPCDSSGNNRLGSVKRRISSLVRDLRCFDVTTIEHRDDWKANAFAALIDNTLADIFGRNSQEYEEYSIRSFDTLPPAADVDCPLPEVRQRYKKGINTAVQKLNLLLDTLDTKMGAAEGVTAPVPHTETPVTSSINEKISLVTMRAKLRNRFAPSPSVSAAHPGHRKLVKAEPGLGAAAERVHDAQLDEPQAKESTAGAGNRGSADILGKSKKEHNRCRVDKSGLAGLFQKYDPLAAGQDEDLFLEYLEAMQAAREAEELSEEKSAQDEPETAAIMVDQDTPADIAATAIPADYLVGAAVQLETQQDEDSRSLEPEELISSEFSYQEPRAWSLPDKPFGDQPGTEALVPVDEAIVLRNDELPIANAISTLTEESSLFAAVQAGLDAAEYEEPSANILAEPYHEVVHIDTLLRGSGEPQTLILPDSELAAEVPLPEPDVGERQETTPWSPYKNLTIEISAEPVIEPSTAPVSLGPLRLAQVLSAAWEKNDFQIAAFSAHPDEGRIRDIRACLLELTDQAISGPVLSELLQEEQLTFEDGQFTHAATEQVAELLWNEILSRELLSVDLWVGKQEKADRGINVNAVEDELSATGCIEHAEELIPVDPVDMRDIEALADKITKETAVVPESKMPGTPEERLSGDAARTPVGFDRYSEVAWTRPGEDPVEAATEPIAESPEVEQNPFALKDFEKVQPRPKTIRVVDLQAQIEAIMQRINDLRSFDVTTITKRYDPGIRELRDSVNNTIADVFGRNTRDYWDHSLPCFEAAHVILGSPNRSPAELRGFYKEGIDKAVAKLTAIVELLESKLGKLEREAISENERTARSAPDYNKDVTVVERREELPARAGGKFEFEEPTKEKAVEKPLERLLAESPEVEQNPFALKDFEKVQPRPKTTTIVDLQAQIEAIMQRINDLRSFDVTTITKRYDPVVRELRDSVNNTIADVFGRNTGPYWDHSLASFEAAHVVLGSPNRSPAELRGFYKEGIDKAVTKLMAIVDSLRSKLNQPEFHDSKIEGRRNARV